MSYFFRHWLSTALALSAASWVLPGVEISSLAALMVAALVLGCANAVVKPMLLLLTLPITILTLGFFYVVVNGLVFALAAFLVPGFSVRSFVWAMLGAFIVGFVSWLMGTGRRLD